MYFASQAIRECYAIHLKSAPLRRHKCDEATPQQLALCSQVTEYNYIAGTRSAPERYATHMGAPPDCYRGAPMAVPLHLKVPIACR